MNNQSDTTTITQITKTSGQYRYYVEVAIEGKLLLSRPAMSAEHSAIIAGEFLKQHPGAKMIWRAVRS